MKNKPLLLTLLFVLLGGFVYYNTSDKISHEPQPAPSPRVESPVTSAEAVEAPISATPVNVENKIAEPLKEKIKKYTIGKGPEYRAELKKNPHETPDVAIVSALELGEIFDDVKTESDAGHAFQFFANCVTTESVVALQTSCLRYAKRLSETYSSVRELWPSLEASASDEVKSVLKFDQH